MKGSTPTAPREVRPRRTLRQTILGALSRVLGTPHPTELAAIRQDLAALSASNRDIERSLRRTIEGVHAIIRHLYVDSSELSPPHSLLARRFGILSQNGEDGLIWAMFQLIGATNRRFVEIGSGVNGGNSGFLAECGWSGLMVDAEQARISRLKARFGPRVTAIARWITRENINTTLSEQGQTGEIDLFSLDIDGNDYWVWEALEVCSPRLVIVEYNAAFGPSRAVVVPYHPKFRRRKKPDPRYYGASLGAFAILAARKGYRLVLTEPRGINAFFLRDDTCPTLQGRQAAEVFQMTDADESSMPDIYASIAAVGLPVVDLLNQARGKDQR